MPTKRKEPIFMWRINQFRNVYRTVMKKRLCVLISLMLGMYIILFGACTQSNEIKFLSKKSVLKNMVQNHNELISEFKHENVISFTNHKNQIMHMFSSPAYIKTSNDTYDLVDNTPLLSVGEKSSEYKFSNTRNDIQSFLPNQFTNDAGILITKEHIALSIFPQTESSGKGKKKPYTNIYGLTDEYIKYSNMFGNNNYYVSIDDFGVNIELETKSKLSQLEYLLKIENVFIDDSCPDYVLFKDIKNKEVRGVIYKPVVSFKERSLTETQVQNDCSMVITEEAENTYSLRIALPEEILKATKSPIKINQSFHLYKSKQPDSAIYSNSNIGYYLNDKIILGNNQEKGEGQLLIRFEALDLIDIPLQDIVSAEYIVSEISGTKTSATIAMYPVISEWCSLNTRWSSKPQLADKYIQRVTVDKSGDYSFDITEPLKLWLKNKGGETEYIIRHGFTLINETPDVPKMFATGDNGMFTSCLRITLKQQ